MDSIQALIDNLDYLQTYFAPHVEGDEPLTEVCRKLKATSDLLTTLPEAAEKLAEYVGRCQLYGPADATREWARKVQDSLADVA